MKMGMFISKQDKLSPFNVSGRFMNRHYYNRTLSLLKRQKTTFAKLLFLRKFKHLIYIVSQVKCSNSVIDRQISSVRYLSKNIYYKRVLPCSIQIT